MNEQSLELSDVNIHRRFVPILITKNDGNQDNKIMAATMNQNSEPFPSIMMIALISSFLTAVLIIGLAVTRYCIYYKNRRKQLNDSSDDIAKYWQKQNVSTSFNCIIPSKNIESNSQENQESNERSRILKNSLSWPETKLIHYNEIQDEAKFSSTMSSSSSMSNSSTTEHVHEPATLTFSLRWDEMKESLFIRIINAQNLLFPRHSQRMTLIDSYVRFELLSIVGDNSYQEPIQTMRTHIIKKSAHPIYDELFQISNIQKISDNNKNLYLLFTILTYDTFTRDEILGQVEFPIILPNGIAYDALESNEMTITKAITPRHRQFLNQQLGQILVSLCYQPMHSTITFIVLKASNLPRIGTSRLINPYVKIYMYYKGQRIIKKRSSIKRTTQSPVYNESFTFIIPENNIENIYFDLILFDYDRHIKHEPIGIVSMGNNETDKHWNDVCRNQITKQIAQWYQLKPLNSSIENQ